MTAVIFSLSYTIPRPYPCVKKFLPLSPLFSSKFAQFSPCKPIIRAKKISQTGSYMKSSLDFRSVFVLVNALPDQGQKAQALAGQVPAAAAAPLEEGSADAVQQEQRDRRDVLVRPVDPCALALGDEAGQDTEQRAVLV